MAQIVDKRPVGALKPHPENDRIYGDEADEGLIESVRAKGILNPLLITPTGLIISGHRRWDAAKKAGMAEVPVVVFGSTDELDMLEALLESNRQREKDGEQIGREYEASKKIEAARAAQRYRETVGRPAKSEVKSPQIKPSVITPADEEERQTGWSSAWLGKSKGRAPQAGDLAAKRIGVSRQKAERASAVNTVVEDLRSKGQEEQAEQLRQSLKTKSVNKAYSVAKANGYIAPKPPALREAGLDERLITLDVWHGLTDDQKAQVLTREPKKGSHFNEQKSPDIEWAMWSWNPVTGCRHDCTYCYARDIAEGSGGARTPFAQGFVPTFLPERLAAPRQTKVPERAAHDTNYGNVFTCSMADLFGRWVPREWIDAVLAEVRANPQWRFLFLTKFPIRMQEFDFPDNAWVGTTVDAQARVVNAERAFAKVNAKVKWLSCEPLLEPLKFTRLDLFQWVVIGGSSRSTQTPEWRPPRSWVEHLERQARDAGCKVYEKTNLLERLREYPGQAEPAHISVPDAFKMPYLQRDVTDPAAYAVEVRR